jgi:phosphatidylglycerophosphate synthase
MTRLNNRRPLKVRDTRLARKFASFLSARNITPNQISIFSIIFAIFAAIFLILMPSQNWFLPLIAAIFIQLRLLCNLFDGMVAVEGGKKSLSGELFNDIPDRIADPLILIAAGYAVNFVSWCDILGWCAALLAVMTAYVRTLATSIGAPASFAGPMAKQHRMAVMTVACLLTAIEHSGFFIFMVLLIIIFGSVITIYRRTIAAYNFLEKKDHE